MDNDTAMVELDLYEAHHDKEEFGDELYMKMKALESELEILTI